MTSGQSLLRRAFDRAERAVGEPLELLVRTRNFNDLIVLTVRARYLVSTFIEGRTAAAIHLLNLPTHSDISSLRRRLGQLYAEVGELAERLEDRPRQSSDSPQPDRGAAHERPETGR